MDITTGQMIAVAVLVGLGVLLRLLSRIEDSMFKSKRDD